MMNWLFLSALLAAVYGNAMKEAVPPGLAAAVPNEPFGISGKAEESTPREVKRVEVRSRNFPTETIRLEFDKPVLLTDAQKKELEEFLSVLPRMKCSIVRIEHLDADEKVLLRYDCPGNISQYDADGTPVGSFFSFPFIMLKSGANGKILRLYGSDYGKVNGMPAWEKNFPEFLKSLEKLNKAEFQQPPVKLLSVRQAEEFFAKTKTLKPDMTAEEVIAILGKPDEDQVPGPKRISPLSKDTTFRQLYYYFYRVYRSVNTQDLFVTLRFHFPDYPDRTKTALKDLHSNIEMNHLRNETRLVSARGSRSDGMGDQSYVTEKRKVSLPEPRRLQVDGKTRSIGFGMTTLRFFHEPYLFSGYDFLTRMIPEVRYGKGGLLFSTNQSALPVPNAGNGPDRLLMNPDGSKREYPFRLEWLKEEADLEELDLSQLSQLELDSTCLPKLRTLHLGGQIAGLEKLDLPALETLILSGRPQPPDGEIRRNTRFRVGVPTFSDAPLLRLSRKLPKLKNLVLNGNSGDLDFSTLAERNLESVSLSSCTAGQLAVLRGQKIRELTFALRDSENLKTVSELLDSFPLEKLQFSGSLTDYSFLRKMKLRELFLRPMGKEASFDPEWLRGKPLEKLTVFGAFGDRATDWGVLKSLPNLRELIFTNAWIADPAVFAGLPVENLSLQQCGFGKPEVLEAIAMMPKLQMLHIGLAYHMPPDSPRKGSNLTSSFPWEKLSVLPLKAFSYWGTRADFLQPFQSLEYLKITDTSKDGKIQIEDVKRAKPLKVFVLNKGHLNTMSPQWQPGESRSTMIQPIRKPEIAERIILNSASRFFF
ncbi:MAG: hypothetical protein BWY31_01813 [Lentisphaerae bacterium ADurb.Bin242]|nr:MAG: hypothetical protein BWY31_01813 [Lentisphaerae bacterium ADurb.Bin242]